MKNEEKLQFEGRPFSLDIHYAKTEKPMGNILFLHGFKGFKDWGPFDEVARTFAQRGYNFIKFNFAWNGTTPEDPEKHVDMEAFGRNTFSKEVDQTHFMLDWVYHHDKLKDLPITLIGHSRGGAIAILTAARDYKVSKLITWSALSNFSGDWFQPLIDAIKENGRAVVINTRTNEEMPIYSDIYDDYMKNIDKLDVPKNAEMIVVPTLIVHGNEDETVPVEHAAILHKKIPNSELVIIEDGNHAFGGMHPWDKAHLSVEFNKVVDHSIDFIQEQQNN